MISEDCAPRRAAPLPPDERRAAILEAAVPLLRERGAHVSTRELAEAAGVAEGTLFRVFPDKRALLRAAVGVAIDPEPLVGELAGIDRSLPLEDRIRCVIELVAARMDGVMQLVTALHDLVKDRPDASEGRQPHHGAPDPAERDARFLTAIADVLEADGALLRVTPLQAAGLIRAAILGDRMPGLPDGAHLPPAVVASCLVRGLAVDRHRPSTAPGPLTAPPPSTDTEP